MPSATFLHRLDAAGRWLVRFLPSTLGLGGSEVKFVVQSARATGKGSLSTAMFSTLGLDVLKWMNRLCMDVWQYNRTCNQAPDSQLHWQ